MSHLIRHLTSLSYQPAVGESVVEVRLQPRSDTRQRCLTSSLTVNPPANVSVYRDFYGNAVHHFDIPGKHQSIEVVSEATVDMLPRLEPEGLKHGTWEELDELVIDDALRSRQGVCQDFAHIMITLLRQLRIPCRYVSGYLYHGDKDRDRSSARFTRMGRRVSWRIGPG
jgi:transglutaminase-like putative cysteine protease